MVILNVASHLACNRLLPFATDQIMQLHQSQVVSRQFSKVTEKEIVDIFSSMFGKISCVL